MADETIVLEVFFDTEQATRNSLELKKAIQDLKDQQKVLEISGKSLSEEYLQNSVEIKRLTTEMRSNEQQLVKLNTANKAAAGSNEQLRAQLSVLTSQYNKLSEAERNNTVSGQVLGKQIKNISDQLKATEGSVGDFRRNVGDYEGAVTRAANSILGLKERLAQLDTEIQSTDIGSQRFKEASDEAANLRLQIDQATGKVDEFGNREPKNPIKKQFEDAVITAGLLGSAFTALSVQFEDNQAAQEKLAKAAAGVNVALNVANIIKEKGAIIDTVALASTKAQTAAQAAYAFAVGSSTGVLKLFRLALAGTGIGLLVIGLVELITNFDKVKAAVLKFLPGLQLVADFVSNAADAVLEFIGLTNDETSALARQESQVAKLIKAEQRRLDVAAQGFAQRKRLLEAAGQDTRALQVEEEKFFRDQAIRQINIIKQNLGQIANIGGSALEGAKAQLQKLEDEVATRTTEIKAIQIEASQEAASEQEKIADDQLAKRKAFFDKIKAVEDEARQSSLDAQRKQAQDEEALRQANIENAIADLDNLKRFDLDRIEQQTLLRAQAAQANIDLAALEQQGVFIKTQEGLTNLIALEQGFGIQRQQIVADCYAFVEKNGDISFEKFAQLQTAQLETVKQAYDQQAQAGIAFGQQVAGIFADSLFESGLELKGFGKNFLILILDTLQKTVNAAIASATAQSFAQADSVASFGVSGFARAAALSALINGAFAVVKRGLTQEPKGFATGVIGLQGPGTETSDSIPAWLSRGETVIPAWGTNAIQRMYPGFLENFVGAPKFRDGVVNFQPNVTPSTSNTALIDAIRAIPSPVVRVSDINKGQTDYSEVRVSSQI